MGKQPERDRNHLILVLLISAIALAVSWAAVRAGDDRFLEKEAISSADNWARFLQGNLTGLDQLLATGQLSAADRALFQRATDEGHVFRYKVFGSDGRIVFGLRAIDLGQPSTNAKFAEIVKAGRSLVEIERKEDFGQYCIVSSEAYIPITNGTDFQGAIEVYVDMTDRAAAIRDLANLGLSGLLFLLVVFGGVCSIFVARNICAYIRQLEEVEQARRRAMAAETVLGRGKDEAERANRAKSEFLALMSHELRTSLNAVIGFSEIITDQTFGPFGNPKYRDYAKDIHDAGEHLLDLINDILDLSKVEAGMEELHDEPHDVAEIVAAVSAMVKGRANAGEVDLRIEVPGGLPKLRADARRLKQVLVNLLSNAIKFTKPVGRVVLKVGLADSGGYVFEVTDTGIGIAPEDIEKALSVFGQIDIELNRQLDGTGLGLPLTKAVVELHGGSLGLKSTPGRGTTATVALDAGSGSRRLSHHRPSRAPFVLRQAQDEDLGKLRMRKISSPPHAEPVEARGPFPNRTTRLTVGGPALDPSAAEPLPPARDDFDVEDVVRHLAVEGGQDRARPPLDPRAEPAADIGGNRVRR